MMGIYEEIGKVIGLAIYAMIFLSALIGVVIFLVHKKNLFALWWVSLMANIFTFLYLLGGYGDFVYAIQAFSLFVWPFINLFCLGMLIFMPKPEKNKGKK